MSAFAKDNTLSFECSIKDKAGNPVSGATVVLQVSPPRGVASTVSATESQTVPGSYSADYVPTLSGVYRYRFVSNSIGAASSSSSFTVA